jgi:hypothetical protein
LTFRYLRSKKIPPPPRYTDVHSIGAAVARFSGSLSASFHRARRRGLPLLSPTPAPPVPLSALPACCSTTRAHQVDFPRTEMQHRRFLSLKREMHIYHVRPSPEPPRTSPRPTPLNPLTRPCRRRRRKRHRTLAPSP